MAIDTASKRASCIGIALLALRTGIVPDGSNVDGSQRLHPLGLYIGIVAATPDSDTTIFTMSGAGPLGAEEIPNTVLATAQSLHPPAGTKYATVQAVGANFNYFLSGDTPTTGTTGDGRKLYNYGMIEMDCGFTSAKFIRESNTANSKLSIEYFSRKSEE